MRLRCPETNAILHPDTLHSLAGEGRRWPVVAGIPFLRTGRAALVADLLALLDAGDAEGALVLALGDRDDHASGPPPGEDDRRALARGEATTLREAMARLGYGPVGDYFAHRWSAPTFLSALGLLSEGWKRGQPLVEIACGIGQILREAAKTGEPCTGIDIVFSKLWLARRFVVPAQVSLICADALALPLEPAGPTCVLCHDALYFMPAKHGILIALRHLAGEDGTTLVGHAHNRLVDQRGVGGSPLSPEEWARMMPGARLHDDAALTDAWLDGARPASASARDLTGAEALSLIEGTPDPQPRRIGDAAPGHPLVPNPLFAVAGGRMTPHWPTESLAREYEDAGYLAPLDAPADTVLNRARAGHVTPEIAALARRRVLIDLPEAW